MEFCSVVIFFFLNKFGLTDIETETAGVNPSKPSGKLNDEARFNPPIIAEIPASSVSEEVEEFFTV